MRGQYGPGAVSGEIVQGYADELGKASDTETFVALKSYIDNWRWAACLSICVPARMPTRHSEL